MKQSFIKKIVVGYLLYILAFNTPIYALESNQIASNNSYTIDQELLLSLPDEELHNCIESIYQKFSESNAVDQLPEEFTKTYLNLPSGQVERDELLNALYHFITWLNDRINPEQHNFEHSALDQLDIKRGGGNKCCCTATKLLNQIIFLLVPTIQGIGHPGDTACDQTIFGILGDACVTLSGQSISQALATIETELESIASLTALASIAQELNDTTTTLAALTVELNATLTTINAVSQELQSTLTVLTSIQNSVNGTFTALNACCNSTFSSIADLKNTVVTDFNQTWTILNSLTNCCGGTFTALAAIQTSVNGTFTAIADVKSTLTTCCNNTLTTLQTDFNQTWTILGDVGVILGRGATISGTLLNILQNTSSSTSCCAQTFTVLAAIQNSINGTFTAIADVKSTLTTCCNNTLTTIQVDFNQTWTILGNVGTTLGAGSSMSGTLLNLVQDANGTFSVLGNPATILGTGATISGTLLSIYNIVNSANCNATLIKSADFGPSGYTISSPGVYKLAQSVNVTSGSAAITIASSDVILDLQCFILSTGGVTTGILINSGLSDVEVQNGIITGFGVGINASGTSRITINGVTINAFTANALTIQDNSLVKDCTFSNGSLSGNIISAAGSETIIQDSKLINNTGGGTLVGVNISGNAVVCNNVISINNTSGGVYTAFTTGVSATECIFSNCQSIGDSSSGSLNGFLTTGNSNTFNQCSAIKPSATGNINVFVSTASFNIYNQCNATDGTSSSGNFIAFNLNGGDRTAVYQAIISGNTGATGFTGVVFNSQTNGVVKSCSIALNQSSAASTQGISLNNSSNNSVLDCDILRNVGVSDAVSFGIFVGSGNSNNLFSRNRAYFNGATAANQLSGLASTSIFSANTSNVASATGPWGNIGIIP